MFFVHSRVSGAALFYFVLLPLLSHGGIPIFLPLVFIPVNYTQHTRLCAEAEGQKIALSKSGFCELQFVGACESEMVSRGECRVLGVDIPGICDISTMGGRVSLVLSTLQAIIILSIETPLSKISLFFDPIFACCMIEGL